jgi:hypothetical protein
MRQRSFSVSVFVDGWKWVEEGTRLSECMRDVAVRLYGWNLAVFLMVSSIVFATTKNRYIKTLPKPVIAKKHNK